MKKVFRFIPVLLVLIFVISSFGYSKINKSNSLRGIEGPPLIYDFYNFELSGYGGCNYYLVVTVNLTKGFGIRQVIRTATMSPDDTWHLVINKDKDEVVVNETVRIIGIGIDETFQLHSAQWFPNQSCHSPTGGSGTLGTNWIPWSNNYYEFGEDLLLNGVFASQSE